MGSPTHDGLLMMLYKACNIKRLGKDANCLILHIDVMPINLAALDPFTDVVILLVNVKCNVTSEP